MHDVSSELKTYTMVMRLPRKITVRARNPQEAIKYGRAQHGENQYADVWDVEEVVDERTQA